MSEKIPKIIHFCWFGGGEYSPLMQKCMNTWQIYCPDWEIKKWDESNIPEGIPYLKHALEKKLYAFAADYMRFYALQEFGGIYLDTDVEIIRCLTPLLEYDAFAASESRNGVMLNGAVIGGMPNAPLFQQILKYYTEMSPIVFKTIPHVITEIYLKDQNLLKVLDAETFYPYNPYDANQTVKQLMYCDITENTLAIHHWHKTWKLSGWQKFMNSVKKRIK